MLFSYTVGTRSIRHVILQRRPITPFFDPGYSQPEQRDDLEQDNFLAWVPNRYTSPHLSIILKMRYGLLTHFYFIPCFFMFITGILSTVQILLHSNNSPRYLAHVLYVCVFQYLYLSSIFLVSSLNFTLLLLLEGKY